MISRVKVNLPSRHPSLIRQLRKGQAGTQASGEYVEVVTEAMPPAGTADVREARRPFLATRRRAYFNTAAVGPAGQAADGIPRVRWEWADTGLDYRYGKQAAVTGTKRDPR